MQSRGQLNGCSLLIDAEEIECSERQQCWRFGKQKILKGEMNMSVTIRLKDGSTQSVTVPIPAKLGNLEEADYIDNWIVDNVENTEGWYVT